MALLDISEVAKQTGLPASTLRYYDDIGLIASAGRKGLRRQFLPEVVAQLRLISLGQTAGFSLTDMAQMLPANGAPQVDRATLHARADEIDRQIADLRKLRDTLRHVADCPAPSHLECPTFQRMMAASGRWARRDKPSAKRGAP